MSKENVVEVYLDEILQIHPVRRPGEIRAVPNRYRDVFKRSQFRINPLSYSWPPGPHGIHSTILKEFKNELAELLKKYVISRYNQLLHWRVASVFPVFIKGTRETKRTTEQKAGKLAEKIVKEKQEW